ncbi:hypothetical protein [Methylomonas koyamae]|uniref:hypothetical protein n=1 Tax=Methylomonas koyamae TaxID=702114 RepID=UPI0006D06522|nr:hypothetical protein [Methylomonas koyamae]
MTNPADDFINDLIDEISRFSNAPDNVLLINSAQCLDTLEDIFGIYGAANEKLESLPDHQTRRGAEYWHTYRRQLMSLYSKFASRFTCVGFRRWMQAVAFCESVKED